MEKAVDVAPDLRPRILAGHAGPPPGQGPYISLKLILIGDRIQAATYETYQCPGCHSCGKAVVELVTGRSVEESRVVNHQAVVDRVGPLPRHRRHCYALSVLALSDALDAFGREEKENTQ